MLTMIIHKMIMDGINVNNNSVNVSNNTQIEIERERERERETETEIENEIEIESEKEINIKETKSIYPSNHTLQENKKLNEMMDEVDKIEFQRIINDCNLVRLNPQLCLEISEILKEIFMNPNTRNKIEGINERNIMYALKQFAVANTKSQIQIPKQYFKKCILSAMEQTELSGQYDIDTIYEMEGN